MPCVAAYRYKSVPDHFRLGLNSRFKPAIVAYMTEIIKNIPPIPFNMIDSVVIKFGISI